MHTFEVRGIVHDGMRPTPRAFTIHALTASQAETIARRSCDGNLDVHVTILLRHGRWS